MKLYVLPVERFCNASCSFCITDFREMTDGEYLDLNFLERALKQVHPDSIEITGGGEPTLHKKIEEIIDICGKEAKTQMYTNGSLVKRLGEKLIGLDKLCVSRAHYEDRENERIMGVKYDFNDIISLELPLKISLLLHQSGISTTSEVLRYLDWAKDRVDKVVIRRLFDHDYKGSMLREDVSIEGIFEDLKVENPNYTSQGNPFFNYDNIEVEMELRSCACEFDNPVLHADGNLYKGWSEERLK